jgi:hypothetical protein
MKRILTSLIGFIAVIGITHSAFADTPTASFSTARLDGSTFTDTANFSLDQKPWLHISVPDTNFSSDWTLSFWNYPAPGSSYFLANFLIGYYDYKKVGTSDIYLAFNDSQWGLIKKDGDWNISAATILASSSGPYLSTQLQAYSGNTNFTISPEPISSLLFLLGGGAFVGAARVRKQKKVAA